MAKEIKIPQIAEGVESATVTEVLVKEGDSIEKDQSIIAVESDKASVEIPSPEAGTVKSISVSEGDEVEVGDVILELEAEDVEEDSDKDDSEKEEKEKEEKKDKDSKKEKKSSKEKDDSEEKKEESEDDEDQNEEDDDSEEKEEKSEDDGDQNEEDDDSEGKEEKKDTKKREKKDSDTEEKSEKKTKKDKDKEQDKDDNSEDAKQETSGADIPAAPGIRRLARELGVDLQKVKGSGEAGRISKQDVKDFNKKTSSQSNTTSLSLPDFSEWGETERKSLSGIRKTTAKSTSASWSNIPHVFQFDEADISSIEEYMEKLKEKAEGNITITAILTKISASALRQFPKFNASIDMENEEMILKKYVNIGVAVDTEDGLLVPVIRNVDQKTIIEISKEITELAEKARNGKLKAEEMKGGNFTISNLGGIGGTNFTPIVYHPQVGILGVSRAKKQPVYIDGDNFEARDILPLSLSYDHRLIDGAEGVRFLNWISRALEDPYQALLGA